MLNIIFSFYGCLVNMSCTKTIYEHPNGQQNVTKKEEIKMRNISTDSKMIQMLVLADKDFNFLY